MKANDVIQNYNPYEIAKDNRIVVILEPLGTICGYYNKASNQRFIHINDSLTEDQRREVVDCILKTALKGKDEMYFLKNLSRLHTSCTGKSIDI